ncbi:MAG: hypothetical protein J6C09_03810 [Clostridia bacterium]|nr:hypothetical protein [Clostridia bacterium]
MKKTKLLVLILSLALLIGGAVGISVSAAEGEVTSIEIYKKNVSFMNEPAIVFAVLHDGDAENVSLKVWNTEPSSDEATPDYTVTDSYTDTVVGEVCSVFAVKGKHPKDIAENVWVQAVAGDIKTEILRYSILEFALSGMALDDEWYDLYKSTVDYSANVQKAVGYTDANGKYATDYAYVSIEGGTLPGGYTAGVYVKGSTVTPLYDSEAEISAWNVESAGGRVVYEKDTAITVSESISISPSKTQTFADGTVPSGVIVTTVGGSASVVDMERGNSTTKVLKFNTVAGSAENVIFTFTENTPESFNVTVFEADVYVNNAGGGSAYSFDMFLTNTATGGTHTYMQTLRMGNSTTLQLADASSTSSGDSGMVRSAETHVAERDQWFNLRIEYYHGDRNSVVIKTYVNGNLVNFTYDVYDESGNKTGNTVTTTDGSTNFYGYRRPDVDTTGARNPNGNITMFKFAPYTNTSANVYFDNVSFYQTTIAE